ncbi:uncharacterized protein [Epargyreus clarus]|uniref:uncharacterized protein n=1 Tax=Epargyreus clarus TaxID=520877 RepID=UPI003C2FD6C6
MASDLDEFEKNIENLKAIVRDSFARIYATLKARELKTLRQLDAIRKQCQDDKDSKRNCAQNIHIYYDNESTLLDNVNKYGVIDFERLSFDSNTFTLEDYVSPNDDHMYSYKTIEELTKNDEHLEAIEEAALKEITRTDDCVCFVEIRPEEVSKRFRDVDTHLPPQSIENVCNENEIKETECVDDQSTVTEDEKSESTDSDHKKINPTDEWLNSIKSQTETEPSQVTDLMEHSTITCS